MNTNSEVFDFKRQGPFSIEEANVLVRILNRTTEKHSKKVAELMAKLETMSATARFETRTYEDEVSREIEMWNTKVRKLGAVPKGLWLVDMDSGDGYYCWKYPESEIGYWHDYRNGFNNRISLSERNKRMDTRPLETGNA